MFDVQRNAQSIFVAVDPLYWTRLHLTNGRDKSQDSSWSATGFPKEFTFSVTSPFAFNKDANPNMDADIIEDINYSAELIKRLNKYKYYPYEVNGAITDPIAELGDTFVYDGKQLVIADITYNFGKLPAVDVRANGGEEMNHEFPIEVLSTIDITKSIDGLASGITPVDGECINIGTITGGSSYVYDSETGTNVTIPTGQIGLDTISIGNTDTNITASLDSIDDLGGSVAEIYTYLNGLFKLDGGMHMNTLTVDVDMTYRGYRIDTAIINGYRVLVANEDIT